jgi:hypothetical protein
VFDQQTRYAAGYAAYKGGQDADVLDAFPAQELIRAEDRQQPRDWQARWRAAGGRVIEGRMVALKTDPVWAKISAFGVPWPPFDFNSGMGLDDIDRDEAESLGLVKPGQRLEPSVPEFNQGLQAGVENLAPDMQEALQQAFGDQIVIEAGAARWKGAA